MEAATGMFSGQEHSRDTFSVMDEGQLVGLGVGNVLRLSDEVLTENMCSVLKRNLLPMTDSAGSRQFSSGWGYDPSAVRPTRPDSIPSFELRIDSRYHVFLSHPLNSSIVIFPFSHSVLFSRARMLHSENSSSVYFPALIQAKRRLYSRRYSLKI